MKSRVPDKKLDERGETRRVSEALQLAIVQKAQLVVGLGSLHAI